MSTTTNSRKPATTRKANPTKKDTPVTDTKQQETPAEAETTTEAEETTEAQVKDHTEIAAKDPTEFHVRMAEWLTAETGVEITPKQAQIVTVLRDAFRTSDTGREMVNARKDAADKKRREALAKKKEAAAKKMAELQALLDSE